VSATAPAGLRRRLGLLDVLAIGVNAIVGSGVFSVPDDMQRAMGGLSPLAFVLCAVMLVPVALCFAELSSAVDKNGGPYVYAVRAFGPIVGFVVGWSCYVNAFLSLAANATLLGALAHLDQTLFYRPAVVSAILLLGAVNYVGVRPGANLVHVMTIGKLTAIFLFVGAAVFHLHGGRLGGPLPQGAAGVGTGIYLALFPLQGFEVVGVPAGETKNPKRNVPLATVGSLFFAAVLFTVVQTMLVGSFPGLAAESTTPLLDAAKSIGPVLGVLVLVGSLLSVGGFMAGSALGSPRYAQALAHDGQLPRGLAGVHPRFGTPHVAIVTTTLLTAGAAAVFTYRELIGFSNVTVVVQYALTCAAVPILRRRAAKGEEGAIFRVPLGPVIPILGVIGSLTFLGGSDLKELAWAGAGMGVGVIVAVATFATRPKEQTASEG